MIHIQEHLYGKDQHRVNLVDVLHETMNPIAGLYRELNKKSDSNDDMALVIETLLNDVLNKQADIVKYLEKKIGQIKVVVNESDSPWLWRSSMYITGVEINGKHIIQMNRGGEKCLIDQRN